MECSGVECSGVEHRGVEWSGVGRSGVSTFFSDTINVGLTRLYNFLYACLRSA